MGDIISITLAFFFRSDYISSTSWAGLNCEWELPLTSIKDGTEKTYRFVFFIKQVIIIRSANLLVLSLFRIKFSTFCCASLVVNVNRIGSVQEKMNAFPDLGRPAAPAVTYPVPTCSQTCPTINKLLSAWCHGSPYMVVWYCICALSGTWTTPIPTQRKLTAQEFKCGCNASLCSVARLQPVTSYGAAYRITDLMGIGYVPSGLLHMFPSFYGVGACLCRRLKVHVRYRWVPWLASYRAANTAKRATLQTPHLHSER